MRKMSSSYESQGAVGQNIQFADDVNENIAVFRLSGGITPELLFIQTDGVKGYTLRDKKQIILRYSENEDTQEKFKQKVPYVDRIGLYFEWGILKVNKTKQKRRYDFLKMHYGNSENGGTVFYEYDPLAEAAAVTDREDAIMEAKMEIRKKLKTDAGISQLRQVSRGLKFPSYNGSIAVLKADLYTACNQDPNRVLEAFDDKVIKAKAYAGICLDEGELISRNNGVYWAGGSSDKLLVVPTGRDVVDEIAAHAVISSNFEFFKAIEKIAKGVK